MMAKVAPTNVAIQPSNTQPHPELLNELVNRVHAGIVERNEQLEPNDTDRMRSLVERAAPLASLPEVEVLIERVGQRLFGFGPIEPLLNDPTVSEIMINGAGPVWVERHGTIQRTDVAIDRATLRVVIERIVAPLGLRVDRSSPLVDARLRDGSRVHIAVPPLAIDGPYVTIRRFGDRAFSLADFGCAEAASFLKAAVAKRTSIVISGGTGSGKTSLLNALAAHIDGDRVVTIEDAAELKLPGDQIIRLESRPANAEGIGEVTIRTLVRNALRMRPDRIIVGEVRGAEALDMVQAMNTGHEGSMSTCHANSPDQALDRLETMMLMSDVDLPIDAARRHLRSAVGLVVQVARGDDGRRAITDLVAVTPAGVEPVGLALAGDLAVAGDVA